VKQEPKKQNPKFAEKKSKVKLNIMTEQFTTTTKIPQLYYKRKLIAEIFSCCDQNQQV
jgi:hypothetical protein